MIKMIILYKSVYKPSYILYRSLVAEDVEIFSENQLPQEAVVLTDLLLHS